METKMTTPSILNKSEQKLLKRYYMYAKIAYAAFASILSIFALVILWCIINVAFLEDQIQLDWAKTPMILTFIYLGIFTYTFSFAVLGRLRKKYKAILEKVEVCQQTTNPGHFVSGLAGYTVGRIMSNSDNEKIRKIGKATEIVSSIITCYAIFRTLSVIMQNTVAVMKSANMPIPKTKIYSLVTWMTPILIIVSINIPAFTDSYQTMQNERAAASTTWHALTDYFQSQGFSVGGYNPDDEFSKLGYNVSVDPYADDRTSAMISIDIDGTVDSIHYCIYLDINQEKTENLRKVNDSLSMMNEHINEAIRLGNIRVTDPRLLEIQKPLVDKFAAQFESGSYYEPFQVDSDDENIKDSASMEFQTQPKEEFNEYSFMRVLYFP